MGPRQLKNFKKDAELARTKSDVTNAASQREKLLTDTNTFNIETFGVSNGMPEHDHPSITSGSLMCAKLPMDKGLSR